MSKKKKDLFDSVMDTGFVGIGTVGVTGMAAKAGQMFPSPVSGKINKSMGTMAVLPMMSATGNVFGQLKRLNKKIKRK